MIALLLALAIPVTGTASRPDAEGARTITMDLEHLMPVVVQPGQEWSAVFTYRLPPSVTVRRVRTFLGVDRGNIYEGHIIVQAEDFDLHRTSPHKETLSDYDAYSASSASYRVGPGGATLYVHTLCRPTASAPVACHFGAVIELGR